MTRPKIFTYCSQADGSEGPLIAIAEDGTVLARWWAKSARELFQLGPLGSPAVFAAYTAHYPEGFEVVEVRDLADPALQRLLALARSKPQTAEVACNYLVGDTPENRAALTGRPAIVQADDDDLTALFLG